MGDGTKITRCARWGDAHHWFASEKVVLAGRWGVERAGGRKGSLSAAEAKRKLLVAGLAMVGGREERT